MRGDMILAIDQGTTNTKALLVDRTSSPAFRTSRQIALITTPEGLTEQDPELLWQSVVDVIADSVQYAHQHEASIEAIAISNQRETALAWDQSSGRAVAPAISWQCGRGAAVCARLGRHAKEIRARTGLPLAPLISATKWAWLLEHDPAIGRLGREGRLRLGTVDSWLIHRFTRGAVDATDLTNASRTGLLNLGTLQWDRELLGLFGIPDNTMPELRPSSSRFGRCESLPELEGVPIMSAIGDSHAAMFGHGRYAPGTVKATYGTGSSLMALTPALAMDVPQLARTIAWSIGDDTQYAVEGNIAMTGSAIQWLGEFLALGNPAADVAALASTVADAGGVYFVPAMVGLGAPYWDASARGAVTGLCRSHRSHHLARAAIDSVAYQVADVFFAIEEATGMRLNELHADGGATRNTPMMQFQADILGRPVLRSSNEELSAIGAARLAGIALGWWSGPADLESLPCSSDRFEPAMNRTQRDALYDGWKTAVARACAREAVHV
jgi:glycerol kinase